MNEKKISNSLLLLTTTNLRIQEIAEQVGIFDDTYFTRLFKKYYKMTPTAYRKMMHQNAPLYDV